MEQLNYKEKIIVGFKTDPRSELVYSCMHGPAESSIPDDKAMNSDSMEHRLGKM